MGPPDEPTTCKLAGWAGSGPKCSWLPAATCGPPARAPVCIWIINVRAGSPEHEGLQDLVQPLHDQDALLLLDPVVLRGPLAPAGVREPVREDVPVVEHVRQEQVQQRPQLLQVVLQRRACSGRAGLLGSEQGPCYAILRCGVLLNIQY